MEEGKVIPVTIQPKNVYGLRSEVHGNIHFNQKREVIYPVEGVLAFHDFVTNKQKFLRFPEKSNPVIINISPNRRMLAILMLNEEVVENESPYNIAIYDLTTMKKRRNFIPPPISSEKPVYNISCMSFTHDSKSLVILSKPPEETIILFLFDKTGTIVLGRATDVNQHGYSDCIACNPSDSNLFAIGGNNAFKLMSCSEKGFSVSSTLKKEGIHITSLAWISIETVIAGSEDAKLYFIEGAEIKIILDAQDAEIIDLLKEQEEENVEKEAEAASALALSEVLTVKHDSDKIRTKVVCMTSFGKGIAYAIFNSVYVFEKESRYKFERKTILTVEFDIYPEKSYEICNLAINHHQDTVIVTTKHNQIYYGELIVPASLKTKKLTFKTLGEYIHIDEIIDISMCSWRPIVVTASKDKTIRIWNYETEKVELVRKYQVDVTVIELNPNGLFAAVGFFDQLRIMEIFLDDFKIIKTYNFPRCKDIKFSNFGHLMAAAFENSIAITSVYNLEVLRMLRGHNGDVLSVAWSRNDKFLVSGGREGAVYQWDVETGNRVHEVVQKGIEFRCLTVTNMDPISIYGVTSLGTLREISNSELVREINTPSKDPLLGMCLSRSDLVMFLASEQGNLYNCQLPFLDTGGGTCTNYRFFNSAINKIGISYDGTLLVTASARGTLAFWILKNIEGRVASLDQDLLKCQEVLIPRAILKDKIDTIANLKLRLRQQVEEYEYKRIQTELLDEQQQADIHKNYCTAIEELKNKNNDMEKDHVEDLNQMTAEINNLKGEHHKNMQDLADQYSERMLNEYHKFTHLRENMIHMRENYEEKLRNSAGCLQDTIEALETDFKKQLQERQELIRQLMQEMEDKKSEFVEYCRQVEMDNDRNMVESQLQYEKKLKHEEDTTFKWRGDAGILKKKYNSMADEANDLREEVELLKEEHYRYQKEVEKHLRTNDDLRKELEERDFVIGEKEKRIQEVMHKNQDLEKYKQVLSNKISELKDQIEPREQQIKEKRNQIIEMERELEGLHNSNLKSDLQVKELKDKYTGAVNELKLERQRSRGARKFATAICTDIYHVAGNIHRPDLLKEGIANLFKKYADDQELKKSILMDAQVQNEFNRQRDHLETIAATYKKQIDKKDSAGKTQKLIKENVILLEELNTLRTQLKDAQRKISNMEGLIGVGWKNSSTAQIRQKIEKGVSDFERLEDKHNREIEELRRTISELLSENQRLRTNLSEKNNSQTKISVNLEEEFTEYEHGLHKV